MICRGRAVTVAVPFDWPLFLRNGMPSPLFAEVAAASITQGQLVQQPPAQGGLTASQRAAAPDKEALLQQASSAVGFVLFRLSELRHVAREFGSARAQESVFLQGFRNALPPGHI